MTAHDFSLSEISRPSSSWRERAQLPPIRTELGIVACSRCLRVQRDGGWVEAEEMIRVLRSFELVDAPKLLPGLCDHCLSAIDAKRPPAARRAA